jgi:regulator of protease activity HflC (stomatin/prohibitin superfamily)
VRSALLALNKAVRAVDEAVDRDGAEEVLYRSINPLTAESRAEARRLAAEIRDGLRRAAAAQGLAAETEDPILSLGSRLSALWVDLEEAKSKGLRAYGPVPEGLERTLDPALDELGRLAARLQRVLQGSAA